MPTIDLICLTNGTPAPVWRLGHVFVTRPDIEAVADCIKQFLAASTAELVLFWNAALGKPDEALVKELAVLPHDCWHAGLRLGMGGLPGIMDFISPGWMLGCDAPVERESTSWRLSLQACLVKVDVLRKLGGPWPEFGSLAGATLEMGHRWISRGALMYHVPNLVPSDNVPSLANAPPKLPFEDELRFALNRNGRKWAAWGLFRAVLTGNVSLPQAVGAWRSVMRSAVPAEPAAYRNSAFVAGFAPGISSPAPTVTVLVPTVDRYPYLRTLLAQLRQQTVPPMEIIVVDQTAGARRERTIAEDFRDLPLQWIVQDEPGQCTSRNAGLQMARGDYILFIDDDDEVPPNLIELHLQTLTQFQADVSSGVADEVGAGPLPADFQLLRASDVFPTNNTMIRRDILRRSGLFDLAYNHRPRADGDLGMRIYLAGALMILNPAISVLHHHAPSGGLRKHKARTITYAMSRQNVFCRALATVSEFYLSQRYFPGTHGREVLWQSVLGTFSLHGNIVRRMTKMVVGGALLPLSIWQLRSRMNTARKMTGHFPQIPNLEPKTEAPESATHPFSLTPVAHP
jgi:glycosyltransferase involved in cell wall biosynthesis